MALRRTTPRLGSGGGISQGKAYSAGGKPRRGVAWQSPRSRKENFGVSHPHRAGYSSGSPWSVKTTMGYHMLEQPDFVQWGYRQDIELVDEIKQVTAEQPMVPKMSMDAYEQWKVDNKDEVAQHAGRYAIVEWNENSGSMGITMSYHPTDMMGVHFEPTSQSWIDYIQPGYGAVDIVEDNTVWNTSKFEDIDGLKEWCNFEDRVSWGKAPSSTPVSAKIVAGRQGDNVVKDIIERKSTSKWLSFTSLYGYGSEQFSPTHATTMPTLRNRCTISLYAPKTASMDFFGFRRDFIPDTKFARDPAYSRNTKRFAWFGDIDKKVASLHKASPCGKEIWLGPGSILQAASQRRAERRAGRQHLLNIVSDSSYCSMHYHMNNKKFQKNNRTKAIGGYARLLKKN